MRIEMYQRSDVKYDRTVKWNWAKICLEESKSSASCAITEEKIGNIPIFVSKSVNVSQKLKQNEEEVEKIVKRYEADIIIAGSYNLFKKIVADTQQHEIEVNLLVTKERTIIHYVQIGNDPCVLLMSVD